MRVFICLLVLLSAAWVVNCKGGQRLLCYYTNWSQHRQCPATFTPYNIDPNLCTHIIYAYAKLNGNRLAPTEANDEDTAKGKGNYYKVTKLKEKNPSLKVLLSVGGWKMGPAPFTAMAATAASRREFCESSITYLRKRNFDGLEIRWQYPGRRGSPPSDKQRLTSLLQDCRAQFDAEGSKTNRAALILSVTVAGGKKWSVDTSYEVDKIARVVDFINIIAFSIRGSKGKETAHHALLFEIPSEPPNKRSNHVAHNVKLWVDRGAPEEKLNIGIPFNARTFSLVNPNNIGLGAPSTDRGPKGKYTQKIGFLGYIEICCKIRKGAKCAQRYPAQGDFAVVVSGKEWISYDDVKAIQTKVAWLKREGYGGAMIWAMDLDDFSGKFCGQGRYPLLRTVKSALEGVNLTFKPLCTFAKG